MRFIVFHLITTQNWDKMECRYCKKRTKLPAEGFTGCYAIKISELFYKMRLIVITGIKEQVVLP